jgi:hypothetical protein
VALLGGLGKETTASDQIALHLFDPVTASWSAPAMHGQVPSARAGFSVCELGGALWIFGGEGACRSYLPSSPSPLLPLHLCGRTAAPVIAHTASANRARQRSVLAVHGSPHLRARSLTAAWNGSVVSGV